jgi:hypothetical protein
MEDTAQPTGGGQSRIDVWADDYELPPDDVRCPARYAGKSRCNHTAGHAGLHWALGGNIEWKAPRSQPPNTEVKK